MRAASSAMSEAAQGWNLCAASNHNLTWKEVTAMADEKPITKTCSKCGVEKPLPEFSVKSKNSDGRAAHCKGCASKYAKSHYRKRVASGEKINTPYSEWTEEQKARHRAYKEKYRRAAGRRPMAEIKASAKSQPRDLWEANAKEAFEYWLKERMTDDQAEKYWSATGRPWNNPRKTDAEKYRIKYALDVEFQVKERMRRQVRKAKKRDGIASVMRDAINRKGASRKVERELGYTIAQLVRHLERQFAKGMNWARFSAGEIHIDHIIPQAQFDMADDEQWKRCWCLSNLRPVWARDNLEKGAKVLTLC